MCTASKVRHGSSLKVILVYENEFEDIRAGLNSEYTLDTMVERTIAVYREIVS